MKMNIFDYERGKETFIPPDFLVDTFILV